MKAIGIILLLLGIIGLVLTLIFWLPSQFSPIILVLISAVCLVAVWGGGALYQSNAVILTQPAGKGEPVPAQPDQLSQPAAGILCPRCGCQVTPGQQYCGGCGSSLVSYCARCGATIREPSRFCGTCGARLN
jgi:hypothetical protein